MSGSEKPHNGMMGPMMSLHILVLVWSFTGILGEIITLSSPALVVWRTMLASAACFLWVRWRRPERIRVARGVMWRLLRNGAILGVHWLCFFGAIALSNVSVGLAGYAATSLFTALIEPLVERRRVRARELALGGLALLGLVLIAGVEGEYQAGLLLGLLCALLAAVYTVLNRRMVISGVPPTTILLYGMPGACLAAMLVIVVVPAFSFEWPGEADWFPLLVLALGCTFLAYIWYNNLMRHLTAYTANLALNFEPVYGVLLAALIFQDYKSLHIAFYFGVLAIVVANILHGLRKSAGPSRAR